MAEFCLDCLRELDGINYNETEFYVSDELELCEGCGEWKHVVIALRPRFPFCLPYALVRKIGSLIRRVFSMCKARFKA